MKRLAISACLSISATLLVAPAYAQSNVGSGSIKVNKDQLDKVDYFHARRQIQITNEDPSVHDLRPPVQGPDTYQINIPPQQLVPGNHYQIGSPGAASGGGQIQIQSNSLPNAGFSRYAPGQSQRRADLQNGSSVPIVGTGNGVQPAHAYKAVSGTMQPLVKPSPVALSYSSTNSSGAGSSSGSNTVVKTQVNGKLRDHLRAISNSN